MNKNYDFSGYVTRYGIECSDGRTIQAGAFDNWDGKTVPLIWNHGDESNSNVLGNITLEARPDGVYGYGSFNNTENGRDAREQVTHGDITDMSIHANHLKQLVTGTTLGGLPAKSVFGGNIKEVSLVPCGANIGAFIDTPVIEHGDDGYEYTEGTIYLGNVDVYPDEINHADDDEKEEPEMAEETKGGKSTKEIWETMNEDQQNLTAYMVQMALENKGDGDDDAEHSDDDYYENGDDYMKHSAFTGNSGYTYEDELKHSQDGLRNELNSFFKDNSPEVLRKKREITSLRDFIGDSVMAMRESLTHGDDDLGLPENLGVTYGIENIGFLFPDAKALNNEPDFIKRDTTWVGKFYGKTKKTPFAKIKTVHADITEERARAKGYITGNQKWAEVFTLLTREVGPTTIYKLQEMDRDIVLDITSLNVLAFIKKEMRWMLDEEIARAGLVGDGREPDDRDKINETNIKPIYTDADLYSIKVAIPVTNKMNEADKAKALIRAAIKARKKYKGSGSPTMFTTADNLTEMLLLEDGVGRDLYDTEEKLARKVRASEIVECEVMEGLTREVEGKTRELAAIIVNPVDYTYGANNGGEVTMFEDFDLHFNKHEVLMETRCSGMLVKPFSAIVLEFVPAE